MTILASWQMSGCVMALRLAAPRAIPAGLRETAQIDGAGSVACYRHVAVPVVMPVTFTVFVILGTIVLRLFDLTSAITSSGPAYADDTLAFFIGGSPRPGPTPSRERRERAVDGALVSA